MNDNNTLGKGISYDPYKTTDKHYFGGYLNLAINNIDTTLTEFFIRITKKEGNNETDIRKKINLFKEIFTEDMSLVEYERYISILEGYFPIIGHLDRTHTQINGSIKETSKEKRILNFKNNFTALLDHIDKLRNFYTHCHHDPIAIEQCIFDFLDESLLTTVLETKENYLKTDKTKQLLRVSLRDELKMLCDEKRRYLQENNIKFNPKDTEAIENAVYNDAFKNFIYKKGENFYLTDYKKTKLPATDKSEKDFHLDLSVSGIVYFLSFFLSRKELELFKGNIKGFKGNIIKGTLDFGKNSLYFMATHRIYSTHCFKGLKKKVRATRHDIKQTLLMQMLDELSKVPHVIYNHLETELKDTFIEDWNEYFKEYEENQDNLENSKVIHPVIRKRYEDKFNYFALRFLDNCIAFPSLRFQVYAGDYIHHKMKKRFAENKITSERIIKEKITVFARLDEINMAKTNYFNEQPIESDSSWEFFPNPSYDFPKQHTEAGIRNDKQKNAEKIGIYLKLKDKRLIDSINDAKKELNPDNRSITKHGKKQIIETIIDLNTDNNNQPIVYTGEPLAYLSTHDLPSILYDLLVNKETAQSVENKINKQIQKQLEEIKNKNTSTKILKKYDGAQEFPNIDLHKLHNDLVKDKDILIDLLDEHDYRIKDYEQTKKSRNYPHKRSHILYASEKGRIAVWIANDIKRFMPPSFKSTWKGYQHSELQRLFSYYESNHQLLKELLKDLDIEKLPFDLSNCFKKTTLENFYQTYLEKRIEYNHQLIQQLKVFTGQPKLFKKVLNECFKFLKEKNYKRCDLDKQVKRLLAVPVFIERGFLDNKPTMIPNLSFEDNKKDFADWFVYYKDYTKFQKFYDVESYPILCNDKKESYQLQTKIKRQQRNDVFTLLMIKKLFQQIFDQEKELTLSELFQSREERLKNIQYAKDTQQRNINFIWNKTVELGLLKNKIIISDVKLKDIGKFKAYETDQRILSFLEYEPEKEWFAYLPNHIQKDDAAVRVIEFQLEKYEKVRAHQLLKEVQRLEHYIYVNAEDKEVLKNDKNPNFRNYVLKGLFNRDLNKEFTVIKTGNIKDIKEKAEKLEQQLFILITIRNKFAHNKIPNKEFYDFCNEILPLEPHQFYADYYLALFRFILKSLNIKSISEDEK